MCTDGPHSHAAMPFQLKRNLTSQLQIPRSRYGSIPSAKAGALDIGHEIIQERMRVKHIESLSANLNIPAFFNREILSDPKIQVRKAETAKV